MNQISQRLRLVTIVVCMLLGVSAAASGIAAQSENGNSAAAHACQQGGFRFLEGSDGTRFKNAGQCTSFAARGGELRRIPPKISVSFSPVAESPDPTALVYCNVHVTLEHFEPNTEYEVLILFTVGHMTTDGNGYVTGTPIGTYRAENFAWAEVGDISSEGVYVAC